MNSAEDPEAIMRRKFPRMKPVKSVPSLFSLSGFGLGMSGRRDFDAETGTYVKSHCITALFIPLFTLGAYRVADAENGGWYFLGKEEKSTFSKLWNLVVVGGIAMLIGFGWWTAKTNSPEYKAAQRLEEAAGHAAGGDYLEAADVYRDMIVEGLPSKEKAKEELRNVLTQALLSDSPATVVAAIDFTADLPPFHFGNTEFVPGLQGHVQSAVDRFSKDRPEEALRILEASENLATVPDDLEERKEELLLRLATIHPENTGYAVTLAGIYESSERMDEALALLQPHAGNLGTGEGTRILGQILLAKGQAAEAAPLLEEYIQPRLKKWRASEKKYQNAAENAYQRVIESLNRNEGPKTFYTKYELAKSEEEKDKMVDDYVYARMQRDMAYQRAGREYEMAGRIVPVIMDLGISELQAAQAITDPARRKALLDKAEQHFLSLKETAGDSGEFKFFLGQVYYWSGRQDEGRKLFDELLEASGRDFQTLVSLSGTLREIGNVGEARSLVEEAFGKAANKEEKDTAASQRALLFTDLDDQIRWLEKMAGGNLTHTTRLAGARASKAASDGNTAEAIKQLHVAEDGWSKLPVSAATLNNGALVQFELFSHTGDVSHHESGSRMMERAVALLPDNSILLGNAASSLATTGMMQIADGRLDPQILKEGVGFDTLRFLYHDEPSRSQFAEALAANENFTRGLEFLDRALLLSPNNQELYGMAVTFHGFLLDHQALERIATRIESAQIDHASAIEDYQKFVRGENDETLKSDLRNNLKHLEELLASIEDEAQRRHIMVSMAGIRLSLFNIGETADLEKEIAFLRQAAKANPCVRNNSTLVTALAQKACLALAGESPAFSKLLEATRRTESAENTLIFALTSETLRPIVLANATAKEALAEKLKQDERFPSTVGPAEVIIAGNLAPGRAGEIRELFHGNRFLPISDRYMSVSTPWHPRVVMNRYLTLIAEGKDDEAKAHLGKARADGIAVPVL